LTAIETIGVVPPRVTPHGIVVIRVASLELVWAEDPRLYERQPSLELPDECF
jgi:hypothetical protein